MAKEKENSRGCPRCGAQAGELVPVDAGMRLALESGGLANNLPALVCAACYADLSTSVSQGLRLRLEKEAREKNKLMLWKSRVSLIKQARALMAQKAYSEAAVTYEKYIRVLEMVYNRKKGDLNPEVFNNSKRSKELTVVASVYWDLMRIYDTSPKYGDRMGQAAAKLAVFLPFSPLFPDIVKKAEAFARTAKNPNVVRNFLRSCRSGRAGCFVATAVMGSRDTHELYVLRRFRDEVLKQHALGRKLVFFYYRHSPALASWIDQRPHAKRVLRPVLRIISRTLQKSLKSAPQSFKP